MAHKRQRTIQVDTQTDADINYLITAWGYSDSRGLSAVIARAVQNAAERLREQPLQPCPVCNSALQIRVRSIDQGERWAYRCNNCNLQADAAESPDQAKAFWNRQAGI